MLPTIVFMWALFLSICYIERIINCIVNKQDSVSFDTGLLVVVCVLWGWLYWLSY